MELTKASVFHICVLLLIALSRDTLSDYVTTSLSQSAACRKTLIAGYHEGYKCSITPSHSSTPINPFSGLELPSHVTALHLTFTHPITWAETSGDFRDLESLRLLEVDVTKVRAVPQAAFPLLPSIQQIQLLHTAPSADRSFSVDLRAGAFRRVPGLRRLILSELRLARLSFGVLEGLDDLSYVDLSNNQLSEIKSEVFTSACSHLTSLQLGRNGITSLSKISLANCSSLQRLDLYGNRISSIRSADILLLSNVREINLAENNIEWIEPNSLDTLKQLETLDLTGNNMREFEVNSLPARPNNLRILYLDKNQLSTLKSDSFNNAIHLRTLSLKSNQISSLPSGLFSKLFQLEELDLTGNLLSTLEEETFKMTTNINRLMLRDNRFDLIPPRAFQHLHRLEELDLSNNQLKNIPHSALPTPAPSSAESMSLELSLSGNPWTCECSLQWIVLYSNISGESAVIKLKMGGETLCSQPERFSGKSLADVLSIDYCNSLSSSTSLPAAGPPEPLKEEQRGQAGLPPSTDRPLDNFPQGRPEARGINKTLIAVSVGVLAVCLIVLVTLSVIRLLGKRRRTRTYSVDGGVLQHDNPGHTGVAYDTGDTQLDHYESISTSKKELGI